MISPADYFLAWFSGFAHCVEGRPSEEQWQKIMTCARQMVGSTMNPPVYVPPTPPVMKRPQSPEFQMGNAIQSLRMDDDAQVQAKLLHKAMYGS